MNIGVRRSGCDTVASTITQWPCVSKQTMLDLVKPETNLAVFYSPSDGSDQVLC